MMPLETIRKDALAIYGIKVGVCGKSCAWKSKTPVLPTGFPEYEVPFFIPNIDPVREPRGDF
jgi:hypothetical protein